MTRTQHTEERISAILTGREARKHGISGARRCPAGAAAISWRWR